MRELRISGVSERDTDLLLLEEFVASPDFCEWFVKVVCGDEFQQLVDATRSVTSSNGESDLEVIIESRNHARILFLIENKVNAGFQPKQAERYRKRGKAYVRQSKVDTFRTVLIAPQIYCNGEKSGFDYRINYENLREFFSYSSLPFGRKFYKTNLLSAAIKKGVSGYQMIADSVVSDFWRSYWTLARDIAPELHLEEPTKKPAGAGFIYFHQADLPEDVALVHKLGGAFDLQFASMGKKLAQMREVFDDRLEGDMNIVRAAKSASIRLLVPQLSTADPFGEQVNDAIRGLKAGRRLLNWARVILDQETLERLRE